MAQPGVTAGQPGSRAYALYRCTVVKKLSQQKPLAQVSTTAWNHCHRNTSLPTELVTLRSPCHMSSMQ